jgi:predicted NBD/HSP70 family sugar kinase
MKPSATSAVLRNINRSAVLEIIRQQQVISYTQIAHHLNVSFPTAMRIVEELIQLNFVRPVGFSQEPIVGRPRSLIEFNGGAYCVIGIDLGGVDLFGAITDLSGNILAEARSPVTKGDAQANIATTLNLIDQLVAIPRPADQKILGIGIGAPGVTHSKQGMVTWAPNLGWSEMRIRDVVQAKFDIPTFVENDVNIATLAELSFGAGKGIQNFICLYLREGLGAGIVIAGMLFRGHDNAAGEVGYLPPGLQYLGVTDKEFGIMERFASSRGIVNRGKRMLKEKGQKRAKLSIHQIVSAAKGGEDWAVDLLDDTARYLAFTVASMTSILNPEVICLGGGVIEQVDGVISSIIKNVEGGVPYLPKIVASPLGKNAVILGTVNLVLAEVMDFTMLKTFV